MLPLLNLTPAWAEVAAPPAECGAVEQATALDPVLTDLTAAVASRNMIAMAERAEYLRRLLPCIGDEVIGRELAARIQAMLALAEVGQPESAEIHAAWAGRAGGAPFARAALGDAPALAWFDLPRHVEPVACPRVDGVLVVNGAPVAGDTTACPGWGVFQILDPRLATVTTTMIGSPADLPLFIPPTDPPKPKPPKPPIALIGVGAGLLAIGAGVALVETSSTWTYGPADLQYEQLAPRQTVGLVLLMAGGGAAAAASVTIILGEAHERH